MAGHFLGLAFVRRCRYISFVVLYFVQATVSQTSTQSACYDKNGIAKTCLTYPKNIALNRKVIATNTCGRPSETYCQIGADKDRCQICDANNAANAHPPKFMVDFFNPSNVTWWQSQSWWQTNMIGLSTLNEPLKVNVTVNFEKLYLITGSIRITFRTVRPQKMIIHRSNDYGKSWKTYQYFAKNCLSDYNLVADPVITSSNKYLATCSQRFSREQPFSGGSVVFDPRNTRYIVSQYLDVNVQQYLAATDVRLQLEYPGTDGRQSINSSSTLNQYYYAISDVVVDGRCDCNGHAEYCDFINGTELCDCKHFTTGQDCQICLPLYRNRPWMAGNATNANECQKCKCNDHASSCIYDANLNTGICQNCQHNTRGIHCEQCVDKFYRNVSKPLNHVNVCVPCDCFMLGVSDNGSCLQNAAPSQLLGQCNCKSGVFGRKCDQCLPGRWGFVQPPIGTCFGCACHVYGTAGRNTTCNQYTGQCNCKSNIQGRTCSECKDRFYSFPTDANSDCLPCTCDAAGGFPVCNKLNGVCTCRRGITGRNCSVVQNGYYFPNFTHVKYEIEMRSTGNHQYYWLLKGYSSIYLGIGHVKLSQGQSITYTFQVPVSYRYYFSLRYSLYPMSWYNLVYLYNAELLTWSGDQSIASYLTPTDKSSSWNVSVDIRGQAGVLIKETQFSIGSLLVGEARFWNDTTVLQLSKGQVYRVTLRYLTGFGIGTPWPLLIDSVVLMPDLSVNSYYTMQSAFTRQEIWQCYMQSKQLHIMPSMASICKQHTFGFSLIMYNGTLPCDCFAPGTLNPSTCEQYGGQCNCTIGYGGRRCDHCLPGYIEDRGKACFACGCSIAGSSTPVCNQTNGNCFCKMNTQGRKCGTCKAGTFGLSGSNPDGCQSCFGFGHLTSCKSASGFERKEFVSNFTLWRRDGWSLIRVDGTPVNSRLSPLVTGLQLFDNGMDILYLSAPSKFLGYQLLSYGQLLIVEMFISSNLTGALLTSRPWHVRLSGGGMTAVFNLYPTPSRTGGMFTVRLHEKFMVNQTKLSEFQFKSLLGQLTALHIGVNYYVSGGFVTFKAIKMETANFTSFSVLNPVQYVENATCKLGYEGLSCERCIPGYTRAIPNGGPLIRCVPCNCNGRSTDCDRQNGVCRNCRTGTTGDHCEKCMPNMMLPNCTSCMPGYWKISAMGCQPCNCFLPGTVNGNTAICDLISGQCSCNASKNVEGRQCNQCKQNAYNVSLGELRCKQCPPCYSLIEKDYILLHHQMSLLQNEVNKLIKDPILIAIAPLHQSISTITVLVSNLSSRATASLTSVNTLNAQWAMLQANIVNLQTAVSTTTSTAFNNAIARTSMIISYYNQSFASLVAISNNVVSSNALLTSSVANAITQQSTAVRQLGVLLNETKSQFASVQIKLNEANSLSSTASSRVSLSIQTAASAASNSQSYQSSVGTIASSMTTLRTSVIATQNQGSQLQAFAMTMKNNATGVSKYATELRSNVTMSLPDYSKTIAAVSTITQSLTAQTTNLDNLITTANSANIGIGQQITLLKQTNTVLNSRISTTERRLTALKTKVDSAVNVASTASTSALNTEKEAVSIFNTVQNFQVVSQQASNDAANALKQIGDVQGSTNSALNVTNTFAAQVAPIKSKVDLAVNISKEAHQIAINEQQVVQKIHGQAVKLQNDSQSLLLTIGHLKIQAYVNTNITPLMSKCMNYTLEANRVLQRAKSVKTQAQSSVTTVKTQETSITQTSTRFSVIPTVNVNQLSSINDNLLRVRQAFLALDAQDELARLRGGIEATREKITNYRLKINSLKSAIAVHKTMYNSLTSLACQVPSQVP